MRDNNFVDKFIPKTKEQIREENERREFLARYNLFKEQTKKTNVLGEDVIKAAERITNSSFYQKPPQQTVAVADLLNEQTDLKIKLSDPLVVKDGKISIDPQKLSDMISKQFTTISNKTIEQFLKTNGYDNIYGGGAVGIKTEDFEGNQIPVLKSVSDIVFKGDGVTVTRNGKNIEVDIPGASVLAGDPTIDFARESTTLNILQMINAMSDIVNDIQGVVIPTYYSEGIGGNTGNWTAI